MDQADVYRELSGKLMMANSVLMPRIWRMICTEEEAGVLALLPGTAEELAGKSGMEPARLQRMLDELYHRGAVFEAEKDGRRVYRLPRHVVQFHDASLLWDSAPAGFSELWVEFMDTEYRDLLKLVTTAGIPSFMRVIPIHETVEAKSRVLAFEDAAGLVRSAKRLAVVPCVCRKSNRGCDKPLEVCLQINRGAEYTLKRGTGREITVDEAISILKKAEEEGLVHMVENRGAAGNAICNCCDCCCEMLRYAKISETKGVLAPSRFRALVSEKDCTSCGLCGDICPVSALVFDDNGIPSVTDDCIGCGLCASACVASAIVLRELRPESFIPA